MTSLAVDTYRSSARLTPDTAVKVTTKKQQIMERARDKRREVDASAKGLKSAVVMGSVAMKQGSVTRSTRAVGLARARLVFHPGTAATPPPLPIATCASRAEPVPARHPGTQA